MPLRPCEKCQSLSRVVNSPSLETTVLTVRCNRCGHVWTEPKPDNYRQPPEVVDNWDSERPETALPLHCQRCGQLVTLTYTPGNQFRTGAWSCPNVGCGHIQRIDLVGSIVRVVARSQSPTD